MDGAGDGIDLVEHAVDAEPDAQIALGGLDVHVRRAVLDGLLDQRVDVAHDGRVVLGRVERLHEGCVRGSERGGDVVEVGLGALEAVEGLHQLVAGDHDRTDLHARRSARVVECKHVAGVDDRDVQLAVLDRDAEHAVAAGQRERDLGGSDRVDRVLGQIDGFEPVRLGERLGEFDLGDDSRVEQDVPQVAAGLGGFLRGRVEYGCRDATGA